MYYATLQQLKTLRDLPDADEDGLLTDFLAQASTWINFWKERRFDVRQETRVFDVPENPGIKRIGRYPGLAVEARANQVLRVDDDLISVVTLTNGDGSVIPAGGYWLENPNETPHFAIRLKSSYGWQPGSDGEYHQAISVNGLWGYHDHYSQAWVDSNDDLVAGINNSVTALQVTDVNGAAADLRTPRFQAGQMICIDSEFMLVQAASATTAPDTLTVQRAYNGTTAAAHSLGAAIYIYRPMEIVERACLRLAQWMYSQKDTDNFDRIFTAPTGTISIPSALPADIKIFLGGKRFKL